MRRRDSHALLSSGRGGIHEGGHLVVMPRLGDIWPQYILMTVSNSEAEAALRSYLVGAGYSLSEPRGHGETGVDLIAAKGGQVIHIEIIGYSSKPPKRARDFFEAFFRAISRLKENAVTCVIAAPREYSRGLHLRAANYGIAWSRLGDAFPELEIWLIDCSQEIASVEVTRWNDWLLPSEVMH